MDRVSLVGDAVVRPHRMHAFLSFCPSLRVQLTDDFEGAVSRADPPVDPLEAPLKFSDVLLNLGIVRLLLGQAEYTLDLRGSRARYHEFRGR